MVLTREDVTEIIKNILYLHIYSSVTYDIEKTETVYLCPDLYDFLYPPESFGNQVTWNLGVHGVETKICFKRAFFDRGLYYRDGMLVEQKNGEEVYFYVGVLGRLERDKSDPSHGEILDSPDLKNM